MQQGAPTRDWVTEHLSRGRSPAAVALLHRAVALLESRAPDTPSPDSAHPAATHPRAVALALQELELDHETIAAALLGPAVAAGRISAAEVEHAAGGAVADLTRGLGKLARVSALSRAEGAAPGDREQIDHLRKLLLALVDDVRVVLILLADRLVGMRERAGLDSGEARAAATAARDLYAPLASRLGIWQVKWELEDRAFRCLDPATYRRIAEQLAETRVGRERAIDAAVAELSRLLARSGIAAEVRGRPKHIYSIWRKMRAKQLGFEQVFDVQAVRVIVGDVEQCYAALGVVHTHWRYIPQEFDDYIANPKSNGYRSLHTAVIGPGGNTLEVQIRTPQMHAHAERGIAAHWRYKEGAGRDTGIERKIGWLRQLLEGLEGPAAPGRAPDGPDGGAGSEIEHERIYVVTPRGKVLDLPRGATGLDFAYRIHTDVGHRCRGAKVNGAIVPLTQPLQSGQQVEVLTARHGGPSRDWLNPDLGYLRTARARAKVRHWFKEQDRDRNLASGRDSFERELRRLGIAEPDVDSLLERFNLTRFEDLLVAIGSGDVSPAQIASALARGLPREEAPRLSPPRAGGGGDGIRIDGVGDLLTQLAGCCRPVPEDPIVGYITRGRGVTVHRRDCGNVLRLTGDERRRLIDVDWSRGEQQTYAVDVRLTAYDRKGLLRDVTAVVANERVNVTAIDSSTSRRSHRVTVKLSLEVADLAELSRVLHRLAQVSNVIDACRIG